MRVSARATRIHPKRRMDSRKRSEPHATQQRGHVGPPLSHMAEGREGGVVTRQGRGGSQGLRLRAYSCAAHPAAARPTCSPLLCAVSWSFLSLRTTPTEPECASALWALSGALLAPGSQLNVLEQRTTVTILCPVASSVL